MIDNSAPRWNLLMELIFQIFFYSQYGGNYCEDEVQRVQTDVRPCSEFMSAILDGYSLDREASDFDGMENDELQRLINHWMKLDEPSEKDCTFTK
jgi:hypothetical protein